MGPVHVRHSSHEVSTQPSHSVDRAGWQAKMASIEFWIPWHNAHGPHWSSWHTCWRWTSIVLSCFTFAVSVSSLYWPSSVSVCGINFQPLDLFFAMFCAKTFLCNQLMWHVRTPFPTIPGWGFTQYAMVSTFQWKPFWLATQLYPQNDWTGWQFREKYDILAQAPSKSLWTFRYWLGWPLSRLWGVTR